MAKQNNKSTFNHQHQTKRGFNHNPSQSENLVQMPNHKHPVFCFKHLQKGFNFEKCTADEQRLFLNQIVKLSQMTWEEIERSPRHGMGTEKISKDSIKPNFPAFLTDDVNYLLALRFQAKKPFLVHRDRFICHVIFIDNNFSVYNHS